MAHDVIHPRTIRFEPAGNVSCDVEQPVSMDMPIMIGKHKALSGKKLLLRVQVIDLVTNFCSELYCVVLASFRLFHKASLAAPNSEVYLNASFKQYFMNGLNRLISQSRGYN